MALTRKVSPQTGELKPYVVDYLRTGEIVIPPPENPWVVMTLTDRPAREARAAWCAGDTAAAYALLQPFPYLFAGGACRARR